MKDVVSLNRMYLLTAQRVARSGEGNLGSMVTGMPDHLLQKIANMSLEEIDKVANATPITFFTMRLDEDSMKQVLDSPTNAVGAAWRCVATATKWLNFVKKAKLNQL